MRLFDCSNPLKNIVIAWFLYSCEVTKLDSGIGENMKSSLNKITTFAKISSTHKCVQDRLIDIRKLKF